MLGHQEVEGKSQPESPRLLLYGLELFLDGQGGPADPEGASLLAVCVYYTVIISAMEVKRA